MRPKDPYKLPLRVTVVRDEVVFLGEGPASFSMTPDAARLTLQNLANALAASVLNTRSSGAVVLLVDDEPLLLEIGATLLEDAGYLVVCAESADAAIVALEARADVRLVFTDINMPGELDGLQLAGLVRTRWPEIPVLLTSGRGPGAPDELPVGGRFMAKPYAAEEMLRQVGELLTA